MRDLLTELTHCLDRCRPFVFCSVVETRGSTPQKAGAAMLVFADGTQSGTLGGGCVEAEVKRRALHAMNGAAGAAEILSFCLDDDYGWDDGLICGGRMTMLVDPVRIADFEDRTVDPKRVGAEPTAGYSVLSTQYPVHSTPAAYYQRYQQLVDSGAGCTEVVALANNPAELHPGTRYIFDASGSLVAQLAATPPPAVVREHLKPLTERPRPTVQKGFAHLPVLPRITLLIVGGGHVGQAVAALAATVDFDVWVLDDREKFANAERFPAAQRRLAGDIGTTLQGMAKDVHPGMYCLIVTRGHNHDEEALYHLARTNAGYVGMIGSKRKIKLIYEDLIAKGITEEELAMVHAPLGLPIGSQTVPEIAISIVAELIENRNVARSRTRQPV